MKKVYSKPEIMFEDFSVTANIAATCEYEATFDAGVCPVKTETDVPGFTMVGFDTEVHGCINLYPDKDKICYHIPQPDYLFNS